ncbi:MAG: TetR/AcrR family transcriptional regulator [Myxococcota bacterium]|nr:TetR/AcrR family transcriptional regulator [Myxococcota bacterium]
MSTTVLSEMATNPLVSPLTKRDQQRLETRELLFELAVSEFRRSGTAKARIRDIVDAAGVVPGTFYFHFPTKDHVIFELWLRNAGRLVELLREAEHSDSPPRTTADFLHSLADGLLRVEAEVGDAGLLRDSIAIVLRPPEGVDLSENPIGDILVDFLAKAEARGEFKSELGAAELARVLLTSILGSLAASSDDPTDRRRDLRRTIDFFLKALR